MHLKFLSSNATSIKSIIFIVGYIIHLNHYIQKSCPISYVDYISNFVVNPNKKIILNCDFKSLSHNSPIQIGFQSINYKTTFKRNNLDRLYVISIDPKLFSSNN